MIPFKSFSFFIKQVLEKRYLGIQEEEKKIEVNKQINLLN